MAFSSSLYLTRSVEGVSNIAVVTGAYQGGRLSLLLCIVVGNRKKQLS
jgi:hypothetical protein